MNTEEFHKALFEFSREVEGRYQDDHLNWELVTPIKANFPWYYVEFYVRFESIHVHALQALDTEFREFLAKSGGAMDGGITVSAVADHRLLVRVKLLWNERPPKPLPDPNAPHVHEYIRDVDDYEAWSCTCGKTVTK